MHDSTLVNDILFQEKKILVYMCYIDGLVQDWGISIAGALEIPLSCHEPST